jgi:hypothetical protein
VGEWRPQSGKNPAEMPLLVEQYVVVGDRSDAEKAADLWRFGPKAFKGYYNVPDPARIQQRAEAEIALDKVMDGWPIGTDPQKHLATGPHWLPAWWSSGNGGEGE